MIVCADNAAAGAAASSVTTRSTVIANHPGDPRPGWYGVLKSPPIPPPRDSAEPATMIANSATTSSFTPSRESHAESRFRNPCISKTSSVQIINPANKEELTSACPSCAAALSTAPPTACNGQNCVDQVTNFVVNPYRKSPITKFTDCNCRCVGAKSTNPPFDRTWIFCVAPDHR